jgi:uncharacterized protein (TIGR03067 family)
MRLNAVIIAATLLFLSFSGPSLAVDLQGEEAKKHFDKLQGTWVMVTGEWDGKKVADDHAAKSKITYEGDKITVVTPHQHSEPIIAELVKIDTTKSPNQMHFVRKNGPSAGKTIIAIYGFDGEDIYHFAFDPTGTTTPKELAAKEKTGHIKHSWKRVKQ